MINDARLHERDPDRLTFLIEENPWVADADLKAAILCRGAIVSAWAYIDASLRDIAIWLSYLPEYQGIKEGYPFKGKSLRSFFDEAAAVEGPLKVAAANGRRMLARLDELDRLRHFMAHSKMTLSPLRGFLFEDFDADKEEITKRRVILSPADLALCARRATRLSRWFQTAFSALEQLRLLPQHPN